MYLTVIISILVVTAVFGFLGLREIKKQNEQKKKA